MEVILLAPQNEKTDRAPPIRLSQHKTTINMKNIVKPVHCLIWFCITEKEKLRFRFW